MSADLSRKGKEKLADRAKRFVGAGWDSDQARRPFSGMSNLLVYLRTASQRWPDSSTDLSVTQNTHQRRREQVLNAQR
jgi:hypothetical protein